MRRIVILPAARRDLVEIGDFIALDNPNNPKRALAFVAEIEEKITVIAERPGRFPHATSSMWGCGQRASGAI